MTSTVHITANPDHDVLVILLDRHPEDGWVESFSRTIKAGQCYTEYVWSDRRVVIEELPACQHTTS